MCAAGLTTLVGSFAGEGTTAMGTPAAVGVEVDLSAGKASVALGQPMMTFTGRLMWRCAKSLKNTSGHAVDQEDPRQGLLDNLLSDDAERRLPDTLGCARGCLA